jgi:hypothetical protein
LTYNPNTSSLTAASFTGALSGTATTANDIATTNNNNSDTFYIPFCSAVGSSQQLFVDSITGPLSYNPNTGILVCSSFQGEILTANSTPTATFSAGNLSMSAGTWSFRNATVNITGTTNTISSLTITNVRNNGFYNVAIQNNGSGNLTINTGLGANIKTLHSSNVTFAPSASILMTINVITLNSVQTTIVEVKNLIS